MSSEATRMTRWPWWAAAILVLAVLVGASFKALDECWLGLMCEDGLAAFQRESKEHRDTPQAHALAPYAHLPTIRGLFGSAFLLENGRLLSPKETLGLRMGLNAELLGPPLPATAVALVASPRSSHQQDILWSDGRLTRNQHFDPRTGTASPGRWSEDPPDRVQIDDGVALANGSNFRLVLRRDGTVWGYGGNDFGQLGTQDENLNNQWLPLTRPVSGLTEVTAIAAGMRHALALKRDGTVWQWGTNSTVLLFRKQVQDGGVWEWSSQLPRQADFFNPEPSRVPGLVNIVKIAAGKNHSVALDKDGAVWAWGDSSGGRLGVPLRFSTDALGSSQTLKVGTFVTEPVKVPAVEQIVDIAAAGYHTIALKRDGSVWGWGDNHSGQIGVPDRTRPPPRDAAPQPSRQEYTPPFAMSGVRDIQRIYSSDHFSALVEKRGDLFLMRNSPAGYDFAVRVPGRAGTQTRMRFSLAVSGPEASQPPALESEMGLYAVDDALGRVNGLLPGDAGYASAALAPARVAPVFEPARRDGAGTVSRRLHETSRKLEADRLFGFYIVFHSNRSAWLQTNPKNGNDGAIKAYFSFPAANPDRLEHGYATSAFDYRWEPTPISPLQRESSAVSYTLKGYGLSHVDPARLRRDLAGGK